MPVATTVPAKSHPSPVHDGWWTRPRAWKNPAYRRSRRLGQAPSHAIDGIPAPREEPEPDLPDYVPAEWLRGGGTSFPWSRG